MARIIHVLPAARQRRSWIVRTDGVADVTLGSREHALGYARTVSQRLANRLGKPVQLRLWTVVGTFTEETFRPDAEPSDRTPTRRAA